MAAPPAFSAEAAAPPVPVVAPARTPSPYRDHEQRLRLRDRRLGRTVQAGASLGLGAPGGYVGAFAEVDPWRYAGVSWAVGLGSLGVAVATTVWLRPLPAADSQQWVLGLGPSVNLTPSSQRELPDRWLAPAAWWLNAEVASEWRLDGGRFVRVGLGHAWLLNGGSFRCRGGGDGGVCAAASESNNPGWSPYGGGALRTSNLIVANRNDERVHLWFVHVDIGMLALL